MGRTYAEAEAEGPPHDPCVHHAHGLDQPNAQKKGDSTNLRDAVQTMGGTRTQIVRGAKRQIPAQTLAAAVEWAQTQSQEQIGRICQTPYVPALVVGATPGAEVKAVVHEGLTR